MIRSVKSIKEEKLAEISKTIHDDETKKLYHQLLNTTVIKLRLTIEERLLILFAMRKEEYTILSSFIKYHLFGEYPHRNLSQKISNPKIPLCSKIDALLLAEKTITIHKMLLEKLISNALELKIDKNKVAIVNSLRYRLGTLCQQMELIIKLQTAIINHLEISKL